MVFSKQVIMPHPLANVTPTNPMTTTVPHMIAMAVISRNCEVLKRTQFGITQVPWQVRKTAKLTCPQLPKASRVSVPNNKPVPAKTPDVPWNIDITHVCAFV